MLIRIICITSVCTVLIRLLLYIVSSYHAHVLSPGVARSRPGPRGPPQTWPTQTRLLAAVLLLAGLLLHQAALLLLLLLLELILSVRRLLNVVH